MKNYYSNCKISVIVFFLIINISFCLEIIKTYNTPGYARNISKLYEDKDHVVADSNEVIIFTKNGLSANYKTPGCAYDMRVIINDFLGPDPVLFVADGDSGIQIFLADTGTDWYHYMQYDLPGKTKHLEYYDTCIYAISDSGFFAFKVKYKNDSLILESLFSDTVWSKDAEDFTIKNDVAYVLGKVSTYRSIIRYNIENPESIFIEYIISTYIDTCGIEVRNDTAYIAATEIFTIVDLHRENKPFLTGPEIIYKQPISFYRFNGHGEDVKLRGNLAYVSISELYSPLSSNILVFDISDRLKPVLVDSCLTPGEANGLYVDDSCIFVADGEEGIHQLGTAEDNNLIIKKEINTIKDIELFTTNSRLVIKYYGTQNKNINCQIFTQVGKLISSYTNMVQKNKIFHIPLTEKGTYSTKLSNGIYIVQLSIGKKFLCKKIIFSK